MTTQSKITATIYVRLSVFRGESDPSLSPERQEQACRDYCAAKGWTVGRVIKDLDVSGSEKGLRLDRPGLIEIRQDWTPVLIFAKLDRLARNVLDFRTFADEAAANGCALVSVNESVDMTTPGGKFFSTIMMAFAEMEAATIAERVKAGIDSVRKAGRFSGGNVPLGFSVADNLNGAGKVLVINPEEARLMNEAADRVIKGESLGAITRDWNARGIKARRGGQWLKQSLRVALTGDAIMGRVTHRGQLLRDEISGLPIQYWPEVLPVEKWTQVRAILEPKPMEAPRKKRTRILSGLIVCDHCGSRLQARKSGGEFSAYQYACPARTEGRDCVGVSIKADTVDDYIVEGFILGYFGEDEWMERREIPTSRIELEEVERAIRQTTSEMGTGDIAVLLPRLETLRARRDEIESQPEETQIELVETGMTVRDYWTQADLAERQKMVRVAIKEVRIKKGGGRGKFDPKRIVIKWQPDFWKEIPGTDVFEDAV